MSADFERRFAARFADLFVDLRAVLDERQRRLLLGAAARRAGRGGISRLAAAAGVAPRTVARGTRELEICESGEGVCIEPGRARAVGAGRRAIAVADPAVVQALHDLMSPRGDDATPLRWTASSTAALAAQLSENGFTIGARTVAKLLRDAGYRLPASTRGAVGRLHPDRDEQFGYVATTVRAFLRTADPVIAVDTARQRREDVERRACDAVPPEWVEVGSDAETVAVAVAAIRRWWRGGGDSGRGDAGHALDRTAGEIRSDQWRCRAGNME